MESGSFSGKTGEKTHETRSETLWGIWITGSKVISAGLAVFGFYGFSVAAAQYLALYAHMPRYLMAFSSGLLLYTFAWFMFIRPRQDFWKTVEHELTHALFAILFMQKVRSIHIERNGDSEIRVDQSQQNWFVGLVPYLFSPTLFTALLIKLSFPVEYQGLPNMFLGAALMFHVIGTIRQFNRLQPDIRSNGMLFSLAMVISVNMIWVGICLASLRGEWRDVFDFFALGSRYTMESLMGVFLIVLQPITDFVSRFR